MLDDILESQWTELKSRGLARSLSLHHQSGIVNLSSNDYLGLSQHPEVILAAKEAIDKYGTGGTSSRLLAGTNALHQNLELELATFLSKPAALLFSSGYHTNTGILPALVGPEDIVLFDRLSHASLIDGIRLSRAGFAAFEHNQVDDLAHLLEKRRSGRRHAWIVTEGTFSMDGDVPPLKEIVSLAKKWDAYIYLDEAHSFGVRGPQGRGYAAEEKVLEKIDVFVGTLSKALGSQGGFVCGSTALKNFLISKCRSFMYTTALAPSCTAAALAALQLIPEMNERREKLMAASTSLRNKLADQGFDCLSSTSPIIPVWTGDIETTQKLSEHLLSHGFFVPSIRPPTVSPKEGRVRLSITHENATDMEKIGNAFSNFPMRPARIGEKIGQKN